MKNQIDIAKLAEAAADPVQFSRVFLRHEPWGKSEEILRAYNEHDQVAVKACHSSGKTFTAAEVVLHWMIQGDDHVAITTAPTWNQVTRLMWGEIKKAAAHSLYPFPASLQTEMRLGDNNYAIGLSTDQGTRFQGFHGNILIVVDEAVGVTMEIFEAIEGIRAGGNVKLLLLGNPTIPGGYFYDCFSNPNFKKITIDAYETPNMYDFPGETCDEKENWVLSLPEAWEDLDVATRQFLQENPRAYLTKRRWVWEKAHQWGVVSPAYEGRVRGRFPAQDTYSLCPMAWVEAARARETPRSLPLEAGLDVAGPGDNETVVALRAGDTLIGMKGWRENDPTEAVASYLYPYKANGLVVKVDATGIGYHMGTALKRAGFNVRLIQASGAPTPGRMAGEDLDNKVRFRDLKAQYYWQLRLRLKAGTVSNLSDEVCCSQLQALKYEEVNGKIQIESKKDARGRGVKSPDRAEALMLAYAEDRVGGFKVY